MRTWNVTKILLVLFSGLLLSESAMAKLPTDWMSGLPRIPIHIKEWPQGKKVAVCFILYVEEWGVGQGPVFRSDMVERKPDFINESFRQYAIRWGIPRVGRIFNEQQVPLSIALNALFPEKYHDTWQQFLALVPKAPIIAHGFNNSTDLLPLHQGLKEQNTYIKNTLDTIEKDTGIRPQGWSSPSVYANADTLIAATQVADIHYTLDGMDSDILTYIPRPAGFLLFIPYPTTTVDMGQYIQRLQQPSDIAQLWIEYINELVDEAKLYKDRDATVVAIGIHPFVVGTPDGAMALRKVLLHFKKQDLIWMTDVQEVYDFTVKSMKENKNAPPQT